jgi:hypothetical protein
MTNVQADELSVRSVMEALVAEGLVDAAWSEALDARLANAREPAPWFVRAMVGFGAWIAAGLLMSFVVGLAVFTTGGGYAVLGLVAIVAAALLRRRLDGDFTNQLALALSLAGQGLVAVGIMDVFSQSEFEFMLGAFIAINFVLLIAVPDKTHRVLSVLLIVGSFAALLYVWEMQYFVPLLGPLLAALLMITFEQEGMLAERGWLDALAAIRGGLLISAFGCLMLSTIYVLPEMVGDYVFYPRPWISTMLLGALLIYAERPVVASVFGKAAGFGGIVVYTFTAIVIAAAWPAPGLILSILVVTIASQYSHGAYRGAGFAFLAVFTAAFFYGIDVSMLVKSASLVGTGLGVLACRWLFLRAVHRQQEQSHA